MPDPNLSQALKEAYAAAPTNSIIYHTIEINHPSFSQPIRLVRDMVDLVATLEATAPHNPSTAVTFIAFRFDIVPPDSSPVAVPQCILEIDNVDRSIMAQVQVASASTSVTTVIYREYLSTDLSAPQNNPPMELEIMAVSCTVFRISATCGFGSLANKRFPGDDYTAEVFPGLIQ